MRSHPYNMIPWVSDTVRGRGSVWFGVNHGPPGSDFIPQTES